MQVLVMWPWTSLIPIMSFMTSLGVRLPLREHLAVPGGGFVCHNWNLGVEAIYAAKCPAMHSTAPRQTYLAPNVSPAEVEKL